MKKIYLFLKFIELLLDISIYNSKREKMKFSFLPKRRHEGASTANEKTMISRCSKLHFTYFLQNTTHMCNAFFSSSSRKKVAY